MLWLMEILEWLTGAAGGLFMAKGSIPAGMSASQKADLLEKENELAMLRDKEQRDFLQMQEEQRMAREDQTRLLAEQEEKQRLAELERMEQEGADVSESIEATPDKDTTVTDMYAALSFGTDAAANQSKIKTEEDQIKSAVTAAKKKQRPA